MAGRGNKGDDATPSEHGARVMRLVDEFLRARQAGNAPGEEEFLAAHPECAAELRAHLDVVRQLQPREQRIDELLARQILQPASDDDAHAALDGYAIHNVLGEGGMGVVLDASDPRLGRRVAIKILRPELAHDAVALARFEREAKAAGALQHPNVLTVHSVGRAAGVHYIVMERSDGPSLAHLIAQRGPLPADLTREIFRQILAGLGAAHDAGLIHRDIKSSNILVGGELAAISNRPSATRVAQASRLCFHGADHLSAVAGSRSQPEQSRAREEAVDGTTATSPTQPLPHSRGSDQNRDRGYRSSSSLRPVFILPFVAPSLRRSVASSLSVKLADFGIARMRSSRTQLTVGDSILGTPEYMSPEQARGDADIDHRTDLYSAGVVLYEMLTGQTPFKAETPTATIRRILDEDPRDPRRIVKGIDRHLAALLRRLLEKKREDRFQSAHTVPAALVRGYRDHRRTMRRVRTIGILSAILCVVAVVAWRAMLCWVPIDDVRRSPTDIHVLEVHRPVLGWLPLYRASNGYMSDRCILFELEGDDRPEVCAATCGDDGPWELLILSQTGRVLLRQGVPDSLLAQWDAPGISAADVGIGGMYAVGVDGAPAGMRLLFMLNENLGARSWICSVWPNRGDADQRIRMWSSEPLGHIQSVSIADREQPHGFEPAYSLVSFSMANVGASDETTVDADGRVSSFDELQWSCVPCISLHRPERGQGHIPEHSILFDLPVRAGAYARYPAALLPEVSDLRDKEDVAAGQDVLLGVVEMTFVAGDDEEPRTRIRILLAHHPDANTRGRWEVCLDDELHLISCEPVGADPNSPWNVDQIMASWRRIIRDEKQPGESSEQTP